MNLAAEGHPHRDFKVAIVGRSNYFSLMGLALTRTIRATWCRYDEELPPRAFIVFNVTLASSTYLSFEVSGDDF
jgi:hypothetical protein